MLLTTRRTGRVVTVGEPGPGTRDVWVVLHGYGQLAAAFVEECAPLAAPHRVVVAPEAPHRFYHGATEPGFTQTRAVGASWLTRELRDADLADALAWVDTAVAAATAGVPGGTPRTVLGFSQGAALAARWAVRDGSGAQRLIVWGGTLPPDVGVTPGAPLRRLEVVLVAGDRDRWVPTERVAAERTRLDAAGVTYRFVGFPGGHRLDRGVLTALAAEG